MFYFYFYVFLLHMFYATRALCLFLCFMFYFYFYVFLLHVFYATCALCLFLLSDVFRNTCLVFVFMFFYFYVFLLHVFYVCFPYTNNSKISLFFLVRNSDSTTELLFTFLF